MRYVESRAAILVIALVVRVVPGLVTFGTSDLANCFRNTSFLLGGQGAQVPYFPGVEVLLFDGGLLAWATPLPAAFAYKLLPIVCDALLALLIAGAVSSRAGLLYALNPVPVMIVSMHGQWDSLTLLFLAAALLLSESRSNRRHAAAGAFWFLSVVVKPYTLPLLPLLVRRGEWRRGGWLAAGVAGAATGYLLLLALTGSLPTMERLTAVTSYAKSGVRVFGFPFQLPGPAGRLPLLLAFSLILVLYFAGRLSQRGAILLYFVFATGLSSLGAQYLCWLVPFALLASRFRFLALYTGIAGTFLALYYRAPVLEISNIVALGAYGMLRPFAGLTPPAFAAAAALRFAGNYLLPLVCLLFGLGMLLRRERQETYRPAGAAPALAALVLIAVATVWAALIPPVEATTFAAAMRERIEAQYDVMLYDGPLVEASVALVWLPVTMVSGDPAPLLNAATLLVLWSAGAALATAREGTRGVVA